MALIKTNARSSSALDATILTGNLPAISGASLTGISAGAVLQVKSASDDSVRTTTNTGSYSKASNTCDVTITPSATSSKILVNVCTGGGGDNGPNQRYFFTIYRDSTHIGATNGIRTHEVYSGDGSAVHMTENPIHLAVMDSPSSTSALVYSVQIKGQGGTTYFNQKGRTTLTCMEIAG